MSIVADVRDVNVFGFAEFQKFKNYLGFKIV
jgi:hypothetical protein